MAFVRKPLHNITCIREFVHIESPCFCDPHEIITLKWRFSTAWYGTVWHGSVRYGTAQFGSVAFPLQFSTAIEWAGLFTHRYNCAASTAVTSS